MQLRNLRSILIKYAIDKKSRQREELECIWWDENGSPAE